LFQQAGGWNNVKQQAIIGGIASTFGEAKNIGGIINSTGEVIAADLNVNGMLGNAPVDGIPQVFKESELPETGLVLYENKIQSNEILSLKYKNWVLIINPHQQHSDVLVYDDKRSSWFFWTLPIATVSAWTHNDVVNLCDSDGVVYELKTTDKTHEFNALLTEYYDYVDGDKLNIEWFWKSQVLHLNTVNYTKRLLDTTFILNDTDDTDEYGFDYKFKAYRRAVSDSNAVTINGSLNKVRSITKKTPVSRFGFLQLTLCNSVEDTNNKLHLSAIGLKYELLGGLLL
jgi:hypothetical protein